jgi:hypothetical protein
LSQDSRKAKGKRIAKKFLKGIIYAGSCILRPDKAAAKGVESMFNDFKQYGDQNRLENEYLNKSVFFNPISSPANVIWGTVENINIREAGEFDLVVRHLRHNYLQYIRSDNLSLIQIFDDNDELIAFVNREVERGNLRLGSLRVTKQGAIEYGTIFFDSLIDLLLTDEEIQKIFPAKLEPLVQDAARQFESVRPDHFAFFNPEKFLDLSEAYPFQFHMLYTAINNFFMMRNSTFATE